MAVVSPTFNTSNQYIKYDITVTEVSQDPIANTSRIRIQVDFWRTNTGYSTYGTGTVYVIAGGDWYSQKVTSNQKITHNSITLFDDTVTIAHDKDGSRTVYIESYIEHSQFSSSGQGFYVTLTKIARNPTAPTSFNISAGFGNYVGLGDTVNLSWSGATGVITGYELQFSRGNSGWKNWKTQTGTSTTDSFTATDININGAGKAVKYRVRALNGSLTSAWKESNTLYITGGMDLKVNNAWKNGSVWIKVDGTWKRAKRVWIKVNNKWQYSK